MSHHCDPTTAKIVHVDATYNTCVITLRYEESGKVWFQRFASIRGNRDLLDLMGVDSPLDLIGMPCLLARGRRSTVDPYLSHPIRGTSERCHLMRIGEPHGRVTTAELSNKHANLPVALVDSLCHYAIQRRETGAFLRACLENNFVEAVTRADHENRRWLPEIARFIYNELPGKCWGSPEAVRAWLEGEEEPRMQLESGPVDGISNVR